MGCNKKIQKLFILIVRNSNASDVLSAPNRKKFYSLVITLTFSIPFMRFIHVVKKVIDQVRIYDSPLN